MALRLLRPLRSRCGSRTCTKRPPKGKSYCSDRCRQREWQARFKDQYGVRYATWKKRHGLTQRREDA